MHYTLFCKYWSVALVTDFYLYFLVPAVAVVHCQKIGTGTLKLISFRRQ